MDNAKICFIGIIGLCIGFVLIPRVMLKWNSKLTKQVVVLTLAPEELPQIILEQTTSANQIHMAISELEIRTGQLVEIQSLSRLSHTRDTASELGSLAAIIGGNDEEAKDWVRTLIAEANH